MLIRIFYEHLKYFDGRLGYFMTIFDILSGFGVMHQEKSGNPGLVSKKVLRFYYNRLRPGSGILMCPRFTTL
jgi:hypothetical protein